MKLEVVKSCGATQNKGRSREGNGDQQNRQLRRLIISSKSYRTWIQSPLRSLFGHELMHDEIL